MRAADKLNRFFLPYIVTNCPNNRTISQDICTLFARYLYSTLWSWIINIYIYFCRNGIYFNEYLKMSR